MISVGPRKSLSPVFWDTNCNNKSTRVSCTCEDQELLCSLLFDRHTSDLRCSHAEISFMQLVIKLMHWACLFVTCTFCGGDVKACDLYCEISLQLGFFSNLASRNYEPKMLAQRFSKSSNRIASIFGIKSCIPSVWHPSSRWNLPLLLVW